MQPATAQVGRQAGRQAGEKRPPLIILRTCPCVTNIQLLYTAPETNRVWLFRHFQLRSMSNVSFGRDLAQHFVLRGMQPGAALSLRDQDGCEEKVSFLASTLNAMFMERLCFCSLRPT
eukprot:COSAG06_NODE_7732_length_2396_cov_2.561924_1_plen_118_part_00